MRQIARRVRNRVCPRPLSGVQRLLTEGIVTFGEGTYGLHALTVPDSRVPDGTWVGSRLAIGKYCSLNAVEVMLGGNHHHRHVSQYPFRVDARPARPGKRRLLEG
jgi:hypothetical protein